MFLERRNPKEYYRDALPGFRPEKGCARKWVELAVRGGMKYAVLTTRHHEGYFIGEKILHEFAGACREHGLGVGFYYSVADWSDPDYRGGPASRESWERFVSGTHRRIRELMTGYGKIDYLFYDGCPPPGTWRLRELHREIRALQPEMLVSRCGEDTDLKSCEGHANGDPNGIWESCYSLQSGGWGYCKDSPVDKTPCLVAEMLSNNRHNGGNLLLHIGIQIHKRAGFFLGKRAQEIIVCCKFFVVCVFRIFRNHRGCEDVDFDSGSLRLVHDLRDVLFVVFQRNAAFAVPDIVHTAAQRHDLRIFFDDVAVQPRQHLIGLVSADAGGNLDSLDSVGFQRRHDKVEIAGRSVALLCD